jgi:hypothetical protein
MVATSGDATTETTDVIDSFSSYTAPIRTQRRSRRWRAAGLTACLAAGTLSIGGAGAASAREATAHVANVLHGTATARLHLVYPEGSELVEEGPVTGALSGYARAAVHTGAIFKATFTIHTSAGSISGRGEARPNGSGRYQSFKGSFQATSGSGRYTHIRGRAELYGVIDRRSDSVTIQTTGGQLTY